MFLLFALSVVPVVQQLRSAVFLIDGRARYEARYVDSLPIRFAGQTVSIADDQAYTRDGSQRAVRGIASILVNGRPVTSSADARIRPGLENMGRYHRWISAGAFTDRLTGKRFLLVSRQRGHPSAPRIDLLRIDGSGHVAVQTGTYAMRSRSFLQYQVISSLGDEAQTVFDLEYWRPPPFIVLSVLGPWVGLAASVVWLAWDFIVGSRATRRAPPRIE